MPCRIGDVGHDCRAQLLDLWYATAQALGAGRTGRVQ
jgi:hypothetical protein